MGSLFAVSKCIYHLLARKILIGRGLSDGTLRTRYCRLQKQESASNHVEQYNFTKTEAREAKVLC